MDSPAMSAVQFPWLISRGQDLTWFIGSGLVSYLAIAALPLGVPSALLFFVWLSLLDGPHVIATVTRTYLDDQERKHLGLLLWIIIPMVLIGPLAVWAGYAHEFFIAGSFWQAWHVAKQHFGFVMLYKTKGHDRTDLLFDKWVLLGCYMVPFVCFWLSINGITVWYLVTVYLVLLNLFLVRQIQHWITGCTVNGPKLMIFACVIPLQWLAFATAAPLGIDGATIMAMVGGLFHALQYHRLILFHNRNRYEGADAPPLAAFFSHNLLAYLCLVIGLYSAISYVGGLSLYLQAAVWGVSFSHYVIDSRIWRLREDPKLASALRLAPA